MSAEISASALHEALGQVDELIHSDPARALELAEQCDRAAQAPELLGMRARARYQRAQILAERGDLDHALELIGQARTCWSLAGDLLAALRTDLGRMQVLDDLGRHNEAIEVGQGILAAVDAAAPRPSEAALAGRIRAHAGDNLGVAHGLCGDHEAALAASARAEADYLALGLHAESARPLANRGVELLALGRPREALAAFTRATATFEEHGDLFFAAKCRGDTAQAHRQLGELVEALRLLGSARATLLELGAGPEAARLELALAETFLEAGLWSEARDAARSAAVATADAGLRHDAALTHFVLGLAELGRGNADCLAQLTHAHQLFTAIGDRQYVARAGLAVAEATARFRGEAQSLGDFREARRALASGGWLVPLTWAHLRLADLMLDGDVDAARTELVRARALADRLRLPELCYQLELRSARLERQVGDLATAEEHYWQAVEELEQASGSLHDHVLHATFRAERTAAHDELVALLVHRGAPDDLVAASLLADSARVRTLSDLFSENSSTDPDPASAAPELNHAFEELHASYLSEVPDDADRRGRHERRTRLLEAAVSTQRLRHLGAVPQQRRSPGPIRSATPGAADGTAPVVAFHVVGEDVIVFVLGRGPRPAVHRLSGALPRLHGLLDDLDDQWSRVAMDLARNGAHGEALLGSTLSTLQALHDLLLAPLGRLPGPVHGPLSFVPDARMGAVPFHALHDGDQHLIELRQVSLAPTLAAALADHRAGSARPGRTVVVAVADDLAPAVAEESRDIALLHPGAQLLEGGAATVAAMSAAVARAAVVHLACHGAHRPGNPLFSRLRLGDRWMTAGEIVRLDVSGALVVLSACESGLHGRAAEPVGLGWAFLAAGAAGVVVSQWAVPDEATHELMVEFHRRLVAGSAPGAALREAQLVVARSRPHPFFWAAFSHVPGPSRIPEES